MDKLIVVFRVNRFWVYIAFNLFLLVMLSYCLFKVEFVIDFKSVVISILMATILKEILWSLFAKVFILKINTGIKIQKKLFGIKFSEEIVKKPYEVEIVDELLSENYIGRKWNGFFSLRFYHKKGLKFYHSNKVYALGLSDKIDSNFVFRQIN